MLCRTSATLFSSWILFRSLNATVLPPTVLTAVFLPCSKSDAHQQSRDPGTDDDLDGILCGGILHHVLGATPHLVQALRAVTAAQVFHFRAGGGAQLVCFHPGGALQLVHLVGCRAGS